MVVRGWPSGERDQELYALQTGKKQMAAMLPALQSCARAPSASDEGSEPVYLLGDVTNAGHVIQRRCPELAVKPAWQWLNSDQGKRSQRVMSSCSRRDRESSLDSTPRLETL